MLQNTENSGMDCELDYITYREMGILMILCFIIWILLCFSQKAGTGCLYHE